MSGSETDKVKRYEYDADNEHMTPELFGTVTMVLESEHVAAISAAQGEIETLRADAARYRHIRSEALGLCLKHDLLFGDELDAAIDAEIAALTRGAA